MHIQTLVPMQIAALVLACLRGLGELIALQSWRLRDRLMHRVEERRWSDWW